MHGGEDVGVLPLGSASSPPRAAIPVDDGQVTCSDCPFVTTVQCVTPTRAMYAFRKHSCAYQLKVAQRRARVDLKRMIDAAPCTATDPRCRHTRPVDADTYGCNCAAAKESAARWQKQYRLRKARGQKLLIDATGTRRRLQALHVLGWRGRDIAALMNNGTGRDQKRVVQICHDVQRVHVHTAQDVARIYEQLQDVKGPSRQTAQHAVRAGWLGPAWWDDDTIDDPTHRPRTEEERVRHDDYDEVAVELAITGRHPGHLTRAERHEVIRVLTDRGFSAHGIEAHTGIDCRYTQRLRHDQRLTQEAS